MRILAIETSCDETAIAVLECSGGLESPTFKVLGNALSTQIGHHREWGGVVPSIAKREHIKWLPILLEKVFKDVCYDLERPNIDFIAVTSGPGLEPALWAGITFAEELGKRWNLPVMPINHMEGHILSVLMDADSINFPALALLVSGAHTELVEIKGYGEYRILGRTRDDAVGEAFDKVGRMIGLSYPAGPEISRLAAEHRASGKKNEFDFPMPMLRSGDLDFSYSGLKTAVLYKLRELGETSESAKQSVARSFEDAAIGILIAKTKTALEENSYATLIVGGGVSANSYLKQELEKLVENYPETTLRFPERGLSTDNAVMIGITAYIEHLVGNTTAREIRAEGNLTF